MAQPSAPGLPTTTTVEVTVKSFIALIGSNVGTLPGYTVVPIPIPVPFPIPPAVPAKRQHLLVALAKATDNQFNENPQTPAKDKHYRLFSSCAFTVTFAGGKILSAVPSVLDTDVGMEGKLQPPPLIASPVTCSFTGSMVYFSWNGKGRPHKLVEPVFQQVQSRTSVYIWHIIDGKIDVSSGTPITSVVIQGSQFPSHRAFFDIKRVANLTQGPFSNLWVPDSADNTKVK